MMFYNKKYDYVCWFLVKIKVCQGQVASEVSLQQHIVAVIKSERKRGRTCKLSKARVDDENICELEHLMLQI